MARLRRILCVMLVCTMLLGLLPPVCVRADASDVEEAPQETRETAAATSGWTEMPVETEWTVRSDVTEAPTEPEEAPTLAEETVTGGEGEALFSGYLMKLFYGEDVFSFYGMLSRDYLSDVQKYVYDTVKPVLQDLAAGRRTSTYLEVDFAATPYDLAEYTSEDLSLVMKALTHDAPYDMYWFGTYAYILSNAKNRIRLWLIPQAPYCPEDYDYYDNATILTEQVDRANAAVANAKRILDQYRDLPDYYKLAAYADEICALVAYDNNAAANDTYTEDINPWTLVNVFDNNLATNTVCEGYAEAFQYLCDMSEFEGAVECYSPSGANHKWNIVRMDGTSYLMDVTHCDGGAYARRGPKFLGGGSGSVEEGYVIGGFHYWYYDDTKALWGTGETSILRLSETAYDPKAAAKMMTQGELESALAASGGSFRLEKSVSIDSVLTLKNVELIIGTGGYLTVAEGGVLKLSQDATITLEAGTELTVESGGTMAEFGTVINNGGTVKRQGVICSTVEAYLAYLADRSADLTPRQIREEVQWLDSAEVKAAMESSDTALSSLAVLEAAAGGPAAVLVTAEGFPEESVTVLGANLNTPTSDAGITLELSPVGQMAMEADACFSLVLHNGTLTVPVSVTLQLPEHLCAQSMTVKRCSPEKVWEEIPYTTDSLKRTLSFTLQTLGDFYLSYSAEGACGENAAWSFDKKTGTLTVSGSGPMAEYASTEAPPWQGYVLAGKVTNLIVEEGITRIGSMAFFGCESMLQVSLPDSLTSIGDSAFSYCRGLTRITLPAHLAVIEDSAFFGCTGLWGISIPAGVEWIGPYGFGMCGGLTNVVFRGDAPELPLLNERDSTNFYGVTATVYYPAGNTTWTEAQRQNYGGRLTWVESCARHAPKVLEAVTASCTGSGLTEGTYCGVCGQALEEQRYVPALDHAAVTDSPVEPTCTQTGLTGGSHCGVCGETITAQQSIPALGHTEAVLEGREATCTESGLTEGVHCAACRQILVAQEEVPPMDHAFAFGFCQRCRMEDPTGGTLAETISWHLDEEKGLLVLSGTGAAERTGEAPWAAFQAQITTVYLDAKITEIGTTLFDGMDSLAVIEVSVENSSLTSQDGVLFSKDLSALVKYPGGREEAQYGVPETVQRIAGNAFAGCGALQELHFSGDAPIFEENAFAGLTAEVMYQYDKQGWADQPGHGYGGTITWVKLGWIVAQGTLEDDLIWQVDAGGTLTLSGSGGMRYFSNAEATPWHDYRSKITGVVLETGVTSVGNSAFAGLSQLCSVTLPETVKTIAPYAFSGCTALSEIQIPESVVSIGQSAFAECTGLGQIRLPGELTVVESEVFSGCGSLAEITIPQMVSRIEALAFSGCSALQKITFEGNAPVVESHAFGGVTAAVFYPGGNGTWERGACRNYGGALTWMPQFAPELVSRISAGKTELRPGEEAVLAAVLEPGIRGDALVRWTVEEGSDAVSLQPEGAAATLEAFDVAEVTSVTISARVEETQTEPARITLTILPREQEAADYDLFSGKSLTLKAYDPVTGKPLTSKQVTWQIVTPNGAPYASINSKGKLTAKKVLQKTRIEAAAAWVDSGEIAASYLVDIYPAVTQLEVCADGKIVNGTTVPVDFTKNTLVLTAEAYPLDTLESIQWSVSDSKKTAYAQAYLISGNTLTVVEPTGKAGTVTVKATVNAGVKKTVTVRLQFGRFAKEVRIAQPAQTTLRSGESLQLHASILRSGDVTNPGITWSIPDKADRAAAGISSGGLVKAKQITRPRTITVTATSKDNMAQDAVEITILPEDLLDVVLMEESGYLTGTSKSLSQGEVWQLKACTVPYGIPREAQVTWQSSKDTVAAVSETGLVTALKAGTAKITAERNGKAVASVTVKVSTLAKGMTLSAKNGKNLVQENGETIVQVASGKSVMLTAHVLPTGASREVTWDLASGSEWAKITASGKLTAGRNLTSVQYVTARATAKDGSGCRETIRVRIHPLAQGVQIYSQQGGRTRFSIRTDESWWVRSHTTLEWAMNENDTLQLFSHVYPYYGDDSGRNAIQGVTWKSSGKKIATVDEDGLVTCHRPGTVTITATAKDGSGKSVSFKLKVIKKMERLSMEAREVKGGRSLNLAKRMQIYPTDATYKTFTWEITGGSGAAYASVSSKGVLKTKQVKEPMEVEITATAKDGSGKTAVVRITIMPA